MGISAEGIWAEEQGYRWLKNKGCDNLQRLDWLVRKNGKYYCIEVKYRELFKPPPHKGTGLDIKQLRLRQQLLDDLGVDTVLLVFEKETGNIYWQYLSVLESGKYFDTKNKIRIYPITNFKKEKLNK